MQRIRKDDMVQVISGKDKDKRGRVLKISHKRGRVQVEGIMIVKKHTKPSQKNTQGGIISQEGWIHISNVMPLDPSTDKPTRVRISTSGPKNQRVAKSGATIELGK